MKKKLESPRNRPHTATSVWAMLGKIKRPAVPRSWSLAVIAVAQVSQRKRSSANIHGEWIIIRASVIPVTEVRLLRFDATDINVFRCWLSWCIVFVSRTFSSRRCSSSRFSMIYTLSVVYVGTNILFGLINVFKRIYILPFCWICISSMRRLLLREYFVDIVLYSVWSQKSKWTSILSLPEENLWRMDIIVARKPHLGILLFSSICLPKYDILSIYFLNRATYISCRNDIFYFLISHFSNYFSNSF